MRNSREAAVTERETKILKVGARDYRGSPNQTESPISDVSNALKFVSLVRVVAEILIIQKFLFRNFEKLQNAQVHWVKHLRSKFNVSPC